MADLPGIAIGDQQRHLSWRSPFVGGNSRVTLDSKFLALSINVYGFGTWQDVWPFH